MIDIQKQDSKSEEKLSRQQNQPHKGSNSPHESPSQIAAHLIPFQKKQKQKEVIDLDSNEENDQADKKSDKTQNVKKKQRQQKRLQKQSNTKHNPELSRMIIQKLKGFSSMNDQQLLEHLERLIPDMAGKLREMTRVQLQQILKGALKVSLQKQRQKKLRRQANKTQSGNGQVVDLSEQEEKNVTSNKNKGGQVISIPDATEIVQNQPEQSIKQKNISIEVLKAKALQRYPQLKQLIEKAPIKDLLQMVADKSQSKLANKTNSTFQSKQANKKAPQLNIEEIINNLVKAMPHLSEEIKKMTKDEIYQLYSQVIRQQQLEKDKNKKPQKKPNQIQKSINSQSNGIYLIRKNQIGAQRLQQNSKKNDQDPNLKKCLKAQTMVIVHTEYIEDDSDNVLRDQPSKRIKRSQVAVQRFNNIAKKIIDIFEEEGKNPNDS